MKKLLATQVLILSLILGGFAESNAQVIVKVKPVRPAHVVVVKPAKARPNHIWVAGQWKWDKRKNAYVWVDGYYLKQRRGYKYMAGEWVVVPAKGYKWVPGRWVRV